MRTFARAFARCGDARERWHANAKRTNTHVHVLLYTRARAHFGYTYQYHICFVCDDKQKTLLPPLPRTRNPSCLALDRCGRVSCAQRRNVIKRRTRKAHLGASRKGRRRSVVIVVIVVIVIVGIVVSGVVVSSAIAATKQTDTYQCSVPALSYAKICV